MSEDIDLRRYINISKNKVIISNEPKEIIESKEIWQLQIHFKDLNCFDEFFYYNSKEKANSILEWILKNGDKERFEYKISKVEVND